MDKQTDDKKEDADSFVHDTTSHTKHSYQILKSWL